MSKFEMTNLGSVRYYLGVEFIRSTTYIFFSQKSYATQILKEFNMMTSTPTFVPMVDGLKFGTESDSPQVNIR